MKESLAVIAALMVALVTGLRCLQMDLTEKDSDVSVGVDPRFAKAGLAIRW